MRVFPVMLISCDGRGHQTQEYDHRPVLLSIFRKVRDPYRSLRPSIEEEIWRDLTSVDVKKIVFFAEEEGAQQ